MPGDEYLFLLMPRLKQNDLNPLTVKTDDHLSKMIICGIPNLHTIFFHTRLRTFASVIVASAFASTTFCKVVDSNE